MSALYIYVSTSGTSDTVDILRNYYDMQLSL